jgi:tetratricopeptide (TPR) repeat protein
LERGYIISAAAMPTKIRLWRGFATAALIGLGIPGAIGGPRAYSAGSIEQAGAPADPAVVERLTRVQRALFSGTADVKAAIRELKAILAIDPRSHDAHVLLGIAYRGLGTPEFIAESVAEFRQALAITPRDPQTRLYLAYGYRDLGRLDRAREELQTALTDAPGDIQILTLLGDVERQLQNPARALELEQRALAIDPQSLQARFYLGLALVDLGRRSEGIAEIERVVRAGAPVSDAYLVLGTVYIDAGRAREAIAVLRRGTEIDGGRADLRIQLARALRTSGAPAEARAQLDLAAASQSGTLLEAQQTNFDLALEQGLVALAMGEWPVASKAFQAALRMEPDNGPANRGMAVVYLRQGVYAKAADHAARAEKAGAPLGDADRALLRQKTGRGSGAG